MLLRQIFDDKLAQNAYLIGCQQTGEALLIDPERDVDRYLELASAEGLKITAVAETHIHADFLSGARELAERCGSKLYLSDEGNADWKYRWAADDRYDVQLLRHGDRFHIGKIEIQALHTPGHTPEHLSFLVTDRGGGASAPIGLASGDFVFVGDLGRPDLLESAAGQSGAMEPAASALFDSLDRFRQLPDFVQIWPGHGAGSACGKALGAVPSSTVGYEKLFNTTVTTAARGRQAFIASILQGQPEPPLYFGRMKRLNKEGPPILGALPQPQRLEPAELANHAGRSAVVLDTRQDRRAFMDGHLPGALFAPLDRSFPTVAGSYLEPDQAIYLIVDEDRCEEAVRDLVRIGLDDIRGYTPCAASTAHAKAGAELERIEVLRFAELGERHKNPENLVLDVRGAAEYSAGHLPGALNIAHTRLAARLDEVPRDKTLLVHCFSGGRASYAAALLQRHHRRVVLIDDLLSNWHGQKQAHSTTA